MQRKTPDWTKQEDNILLEFANSPSVAKRLPGRTMEAIRKRARKLGFRLFQGSWSLQRICRDTGYNWKQVERARRALGQKWRRESKRGRSRFIIDESQVDAITDYLKTEGSEQHAN